MGWSVPGRRYGTQSVSCRQGARGRCCPGAASYRQEEEGPARRGGAPAGRGWVGKAASQARPPAPPRPSSLPALPGSGLPSRLRRALPEAALAPVSPCPSRARSPPPPRGLGALPATPRSMSVEKPVDRLPSQEKRKDQMRKKQQAPGAVSPQELSLVKEPQSPRWLLPLPPPASLPV